MQWNELPYLTYADLFRQFALLMKSGISLNETMHILSSEDQDSESKAVLDKMASLMDDGKSFTDALEAVKCFPTHAVGLIRVAERVGRTEETLHSLADYYETQHRINKSVKNALILPSTLILMMLAVIIVLISYVLPVFDDVYKSLGGSLTGFTGVLLSLGNFLNTAMPIIGIITGSIIVIGAIIAFIPSSAKAVKQIYRRICGDRGVNKKLNNARFAQALSMVLASGLPIEEGIELARRLFGDESHVKCRCEKCSALMNEGAGLVEALSEAEILSPSSAQMLAIGLRTGNADEVMQQITERMWNDAEESMEARVSKIETALILTASLIVGAILMAVMLPLINIMNTIG